MVFYCDENRNQLLGMDQSSLKACSEISTPPNTLPVNSLTDKYSIRASLGLTDKDLLVGYFGLIYPGKGIEWLLEAMWILKNKGLAAKLIIVGPNGAVTANEQWNLACRNYELSIKRRVEDLDIKDLIIWAGFCEDFKAVEFLSSCNVACLPFDRGLTNQRSSFITCAQIGLPVITTLTPATDGSLRDPDSGIIYVEPKNSAQIADHIILFNEDREMTLRRGSMLKCFAAKHYRNERFVDCFDMACP